MDHQFVEARDALEEVLAVFRQRRDVSYEGLAVGSLAMCAIAVGDLAAADRWFREALALARWSGVTGIVTVTGDLEPAAGSHRPPQLAARMQGAYEALSETYGVPDPAGCETSSRSCAPRPMHPRRWRLRNANGSSKRTSDDA